MVAFPSFNNFHDYNSLIIGKKKVNLSVYLIKAILSRLNIEKFKVNWCYSYCFKLFNNLRKEKELRQYHCRNSTKVGERKIKSRREKFLIFSNGIAAISSAHSTARWKKKFGNCGNAIAEYEKKKKKKRCYEICERVKKSCHVHNIFTIFSQ